MISQKDAKTNGNISRINLRVAKMTRRDGSLMKFIAVLGMIFLPATFIAVRDQTIRLQHYAHYHSRVSSRWISSSGTRGPAEILCRPISGCIL
jgi:hypothetical protein